MMMMMTSAAVVAGPKNRLRGKSVQVRGSKRCRSTTTTCAVKEPATNVVFDDSVGEAVVQVEHNC